VILTSAIDVRLAWALAASRFAFLDDRDVDSALTRNARGLADYEHFSQREIRDLSPHPT
jgi:hypothetical protein